MNAELNSPGDIALDRKGLNLYIADTGNNRVRRVDQMASIITTLVG